MKFSTILTLTVFSVALHRNHAFTTSSGPISSRRTSSAQRSAQFHSPSDIESQAEFTFDPTPEQSEAFESMFYQVMTCEVREHLPSILTSNVDLLLGIHGQTSVELFHREVSKAEATGDEEVIERAHAAVEYIVYFIEAFITEAKATDDKNKLLLGKIIKFMASEDNGGALSKEEEFDALLRSEKENFTPGFLRHLEGECTRIANAREADDETMRLLEMMRVIQARIVEELGQDLGEGAQILGQLLGYESSEERLAVIDAGLTVRGIDFALELKAMTAEALQGFETAPGGVDPGLYAIVQEMDERIQQFIESAH